MASKSQKSKQMNTKGNTKTLYFAAIACLILAVAVVALFSLRNRTVSSGSLSYSVSNSVTLVDTSPGVRAEVSNQGRVNIFVSAGISDTQTVLSVDGPIAVHDNKIELGVTAKYGDGVGAHQTIATTNIELKSELRKGQYQVIVHFSKSAILSLNNAKDVSTLTTSFEIR